MRQFNLKQPRVVDLAVAALRYRAFLDEAKTTLSKEIHRYPYDSLSAFHHLYSLLGSRWDSVFLTLESKYILDLGCGDGDCAFFLESLGYRVIAIDNASSNCNRMRAVHDLKKILGASVEIHDANLDERFIFPAREYGLALVLGLLYHLKNPFYVLESLAQKIPYAFVSTRLLDMNLDANLDALPVAYLVDASEVNGDPTNFWMFSRAGLERLVRRAGWHILASTTTGNGGPPSSSDDRRSYLFLKSSVHVPARAVPYALGDGWHEIEPDGWRWTERKFGIVLMALNEAEYSVTLHFAIPATQSVADDLVLKAIAGTTELCSETYRSPGTHLYIRRIPKEPAAVDPLRIAFELSRVTQGAEGDKRELGVIVLSVEVEELDRT